VSNTTSHVSRCLSVSPAPDRACAARRQVQRHCDDEPRQLHAHVLQLPRQVR
jgi:hypothetical protein